MCLAVIEYQILIDTGMVSDEEEKLQREILQRDSKNKARRERKGGGRKLGSEGKQNSAMNTRAKNMFANKAKQSGSLWFPLLSHWKAVCSCSVTEWQQTTTSRSFWQLSLVISKVLEKLRWPLSSGLTRLQRRAGLGSGVPIKCDICFSVWTKFGS